MVHHEKRFNSVVYLNKNLKGHIMGYGGYRSRCIGRVMHFMYKFDWTLDGQGHVGENTIHRGNKVIGYFVWEHDTDYPLFYMIKPDDHNRMNIVCREIREYEAKYSVQQWSHSKAIAYNKAWVDYRADRVRAQIHGWKEPTRPETDSYYDNHSAI